MLTETHGGTNISVMIERHMIEKVMMYYGVVIIKEEDGLGRMVGIQFAIRNRPKPNKRTSCWLTTFGYKNANFQKLFAEMPDAIKRLMSFMNRYVSEARQRHDGMMLRRARECFSPQELLGMALSQTDPCQGVSTSHLWPLDMDDAQLDQFKELAFRARATPQINADSDVE